MLLELFDDHQVELAVVNDPNFSNSATSRLMTHIDHAVEQLGVRRRPPIGAMIETPAALYALDEILELADFAAVGDPGRGRTGPVGVMIQITDATETANFRQQAVEINESLMISAARQHELTAVAESLSAKL